MKNKEKCKKITGKKLNKINLNNNGITLVALVITIIVLIILAGVSINLVLGDNGIITKAKEAKTKTEVAQITQNVQIDIIEVILGNDTTEISKSQLKTILDKYFNNVPEDYTLETVLTAKEEYGSHKIKVSDLYNGTLVEEVEKISKTKSHVGYYADIEGDGTVDGIIYADLAIGGSGEWTDKDGAYSYEAITNTKDYYVSKTHNGPFGTKDVLTPIKGNGENRFYIMALTDFNSGNTYYWYNTASGNMSDYQTATSSDFGTGKANTDTMIARWKNNKYGIQNDRDMWGVIQEKVNKGWFVPSKGEWGAFGDNLGIVQDNYVGYGLPDVCWSSSQVDENDTWSPFFDEGAFLGADFVDLERKVRLSTTF